VGPLPTGRGGVKFAIVAVDYFTKWEEAEALTSITTLSVAWFPWKSVVTRFGISHAFVTDNGREFDCQLFRECARSWESEISTPLQAILMRMGK
jgi:hypothetical protein